MNKLLISLLILLQFVCCRNKEDKETKINRNFNLPTIIQKPLKHSIHLKRMDSLDGTWFLLYGKYAFTDTLDLTRKKSNDTICLDDIIQNYSRPSIDDTLSTDGFQLFMDYQTTIRVKRDFLFRIDTEYYFPVYLVNESMRTKVLPIKDNHVLGIQEAVDTSDYNAWYPIESKGFDFCGNGFCGLKVHPGEFILFLVPKYTGSEHGKMRIRLRVGETTYVSHSFDGVFNPEQFIIRKNTWRYQHIEKNKARAIIDMFYGAQPKGFGDE